MRVEEAGRQRDARNLLQDIIEQFVSRAGHRRDELRQFETLVGDLVKLCDSQSLPEVIEPLWRHPETPPGLLTTLYNCGATTGAPMSVSAPQESPEEIRAHAQHGSAEAAAMIARRADLSRETIAALAARSERAVHHALAQNRTLRLDPSALRALTQFARDDDGLARILLDRTELTIDPEALFLAANEAERAKIILSACRAVMLAASGETRFEPRFAPDEASQLGVSLLALAIEQRRDAMITRVADALDARRSRVRRIFDDPGGEALALTFVVLGIEINDATKIFLCGDWIFSQNERKLRALRNLMRSTPVRAAARIISAINGGGRSERDDAFRGSAREEMGVHASTWRRAAPARVAGDIPSKKADRSA